MTQNHNKIPLHTYWDGYNKRQPITSIDEDVEKLKPSHIAGGNLNNTATLENNLTKFLKWFSIDLLYYTKIPLLGICPREVKTYAHTKLCTQMFIAVSLIIPQKWKQIFIK